MKRYGLLCVLLLAGSAFALPLSKEAQREAQLFTDFLEAAYAQRTGDPARFELLQRALSQSPDSAYLKQQLVSEALVVDNVKLASAYVDFIDQAQDDPEAWVVYGAYQWRTEHPAQALQAYEKALELVRSYTATRPKRNCGFVPSSSTALLKASNALGYCW